MMSLLALFARPWFLLALPLGLLGLIYIYRRRGQGQRLIVSSTILLKLIASRVQARTKFKPPARFFFELLIIALLCLAAADFFLHSESARVAIVVDNSFNSFARIQNQTRLDTIKEQVHSIAASLPYGAKVQLYSAAPELTAITETDAFSLNLTEQLQSIQPAYATADLSMALQVLAKRSAFDEVYIVSALAEPEDNKNEKLKIRSIAGALAPVSNNIAISNLTFQSQSSSSNFAKLLVTIRSFSEVPIDFKLSGRCLDGNASWVELTATDLRSTPGAVLQQELSLPDKKLVGCRVQLEVHSQHVNRDLLDQDNLAWVSTEKDQRSIVYVGSLSPEETGLDKIGSYNVRHFSQESYSTNNPSARVTIFHRANPDLLPNGNWLMIMPGNKSSFYPARNQHKDQVTVWERSHPVLRYLQLGMIDSAVLQSFDKFPSFKALISGSTGPVFLAGQLGSGRALISGFELLPFTGKESTTISILLLNSLKWLSEFDADQERAFAVYGTVPSGTSIEYLDSVRPVTLDKSSMKFPAPGLIALKKATTSTVLALNYYDEQQSNLNNHTRADIKMPSAELSDQSQNSLSNLLLLLAILLLFIDVIWQLLVGSRRLAFAGGHSR